MRFGKTTLTLWILAGLFLFQSHSVSAQSDGCVTCHDFNGGCDGYTGSQTDCGATHSCLCGINIPIRFTAALHPGLITQQEGLDLKVVEVIANTPASASGIVPGDRIVLLNGRIPTLQSCSANTWSSAADPQVSELSVMHGPVRRQVKVQLLPMNKLLAMAWLSNSARVRDASLILESDKQHDDFGKPYVLGIKWHASSKGIEITDVLAGSPADQTGLAIGDRVERVNDLPVEKSGSVLAELASSDSPVTVRLTISGKDNSVRAVTLSSMGLIEVFHNMSTSHAHVHTQLARNF